MMLVLGVLAAAFVLTLALMLDGILPQAPLERLADFPFKDAPATNGVTFVLLGGLVLLVARFAL